MTFEDSSRFCRFGGGGRMRSVSEADELSIPSSWEGSTLEAFRESGLMRMVAGLLARFGRGLASRGSLELLADELSFECVSGVVAEVVRFVPCDEEDECEADDVLCSCQCPSSSGGNATLTFVRLLASSCYT